MQGIGEMASNLRIYLPEDWIRAVYYSRLTELCTELFLMSSSLEVVEYAEVRGIIPLIISQLTDINLTLAPYPDYDIEKEQFEPNTFDVVVADQVLEHVFHIMKAVKQCIRVCKPGGILIFGTPWMYPWHAAPKDFWRPSRDAYQAMFDEFDLETIEINGWGGNEILQFALRTDGLLTTNRTVAMAEEAGIFDMPNDPGYALEIWALARKKEDKT